MRVPPSKQSVPATVIDVGLKPSRTTLAMTAAMMHQEGQLFQPEPTQSDRPDATSTSK